VLKLIVFCLRRPLRAFRSRFNAMTTGKAAFLSVKSFSGNKALFQPVKPFSCQYNHFPTKVAVSRKENGLPPGATPLPPIKGLYSRANRLPAPRAVLQPDKRLLLGKMIFPKLNSHLKCLCLLTLTAMDIVSRDYVIYVLTAEPFACKIPARL